MTADATGAPPPRELQSSGAPHLTEGQLFRIWKGQRFPEGALVTRHGVPVRVISPGRAGRGPGPDFRNAAIAGPSGVTLRGDIELHVRSSLFRVHGHATDRAYANVVLHVVFDDDTGEDTPLPGGRAAPVIALAPWVARRAEELALWLARPLLWREPCHDAVTRLGADGVLSVLDTEGNRRFAAKTERFAGLIRTSGTEQALYEGLMEGLGFGGNAAPMRTLACRVPWQRLAATPPAEREALLIGASGLLPSQRSYRGPLEPHVDALETTFLRARLQPMTSAVWKLWGIRPENHPVRRIAGAAALFNRLGSPSALLNVLDAGTTKETIAPLILQAEGFWRYHYDVCAGPARMPGGLVGRSRALEILVNIVLPVAAASGDPTVTARAHALYTKVPRPAAYGVTKFVENTLVAEGPRAEGPRLPISARRAQGLLALHRDWCTQNGCGRCPLS